MSKWMCLIFSNCIILFLVKINWLWWINLFWIKIILILEKNKNLPCISWNNFQIDDVNPKIYCQSKFHPLMRPFLWCDDGTGVLWHSWASKTSLTLWSLSTIQLIEENNIRNSSGFDPKEETTTNLRLPRKICVT